MQQPRLRVLRRLGTPLPGLTRKEVRWKTYPPGAHGAGRRARISEFGLHLAEKQKVRLHYGISEGQMRRAFEHATREPGPTGQNFLARLERRLDSVVFRLGFAPTIPAARQLVSHGHVRVNGTRVNRAGFLIGAGDRVQISERGRRIPDVEVAVAKGPEIRLPGFLTLDPDDAFSGVVTATPQRADVPFLVEESAIVEFYAR
ncbi:MAG TPA: 30S ribosomal protein S4 [Longimicrobiaceae bacterium]|nr:30S ribosomal protein S4 [Longimicrobiaceae bacterium]